MNNKDALKGQRFTATDGNTYVMLHTGKIERVETDENGEEEFLDVGPIEQIKLRKEFRENTERE